MVTLADVGVRVRHLRPLLTVNAAVLVAVLAVAGVAAGPTATLGAGLGFVLVVLSYTTSTLAIAWADAVNPRLVFGVGMGMYVTKFSLFGVVLLAIGASDWPGIIPMATGIVVAVVAWTAMQIWWTIRHASPQDLLDHELRATQRRRS